MTLLYKGYIITLSNKIGTEKQEVQDMTSIELKERLDKAQETVEKKAKTIERHKAQAEKKLQIIKDNGWELDRYKYAKDGNNDAYWAVCEYESKLEDIKGAEKKLEEAKEIANNWSKKYEAQLKRELILATKVPEAFREAKEELVNSWVEYDIRSREAMLKNRKELEYKAFRKMYSYTAEESLKHTDEEFRKIEEREADVWLLDLYNRVREITGEITDCSNIIWGGKCLDGYIVGKEGKAEVTTIGAGGYNIQRWHLRTLVKKIG